MKLYNTLTRTNEYFKPIDPDEVKMYVCGITPYDTTHLGHAFTYTAFDVLSRTLEFNGYKINYTQNVTDIDDDILKKAKEVGEDWQQLGTFWTDKYASDMKTLNNIAPTHFVKATETIPTIVEIIEKLIEDGFAYERGANIYFRVRKDTEYGKLSKLSKEEMKTLSAERGANPEDTNKENPLDFILWQKSLSGEPSWPSPKIKDREKLPSGRPGWHIECSAMAYKYLGKKLDIHGGGSDLIYPHHESEIAQSEKFTGEKPFCQFWMHTGAVMYEGEKMSKSLGNLVMISELLKIYSPDAIRLLLLKHHYRESWEYRQKDLDAAQREIEQLEEILQLKPINMGDSEQATITNFKEALKDDLNTPKALGMIFALAEEQEATPTVATQQSLQRMLEVLGFSITPSQP